MRTEVQIIEGSGGFHGEMQRKYENEHMQWKKTVAAGRPTIVGNGE